MTENLEALIARVDERTELILDSLNKFEERMEAQNTRIRGLEDCQNQWFGRETAVAVVGSVIISLISVWTALQTIFR